MSEYGRNWRNPNQRPRRVGRSDDLTATEIDMIYFMIDAGHRWREVMELLNITGPTISHWLKKRTDAASHPTSQEKP